jgi:hypothetical protein
MAVPGQQQHLSDAFQALLANTSAEQRELLHPITLALQKPGFLAFAGVPEDLDMTVDSSPVVSVPKPSSELFPGYFMYSSDTYGQISN